MRRVLILGGSGWLGRRIAERALESGDEVTCLARGESGPVPEGARHLRVDRRDTGAYDVASGDWDEVVELAHAPDLVRPALAGLARTAAHWTLVSSVSVYADADQPGADETAALVDPTNPDRYADAKVLAERTSADALGDRLLIARPGLIVGPGDPSGRFGYWPARFGRGGTVLAPETEGRFAQVIDVDDLSAWLHRAGANGITGPVNAVGDVIPFAELLSTAASVAGFTGDLLHADDETLLAHSVDYWAGPESLPLWLPASAVGFCQRSSSAYRRSGGTATPLGETMRRVLDDELARGAERTRKSGLDPRRERQIIESLR